MDLRQILSGQRFVASWLTHGHKGAGFLWRAMGVALLMPTIWLPI